MDDKLQSALAAVDPSALSYRDWVRVGMALKHEGYPCSVWDEWSALDYARYHEGECRSKWNGFRDDYANPVTGGTIYALALERGWNGYNTGEGLALNWDDWIEIDTEPVHGNPAAESGPAGTGQPPDDDDPQPTDDPTDIETILATLTDPAVENLTPVDQLKAYLTALFRPEEKVGYVTGDVFQDADGKWKPKRGVIHRTAGQLLSDLDRYPDCLENTVGDYNSAAGAWIRFNPLDGEGAKNRNVTRFTYVLVESDDLPLRLQAEFLKDLRLPIAALVYSGGKSLHAIVKVDAPDAQVYRERVTKLYAALKDNHVTIDEQNCNPSRLSRMPGVTRNGRPQRLLALNMGCRDWAGWERFMEVKNDGLPEWVNVQSCVDNPPSPPPELIKGVLRCGHKMLISGASKTGKSFLLMELAVAIAEGQSWLGFPCRRGRVLYLNLEIDPQSCLLRFLKIYEALGIPQSHSENIVVWNLRGAAMPLNQLVPKLIRRCENEHFSAVILDPIYKVITGDENNASDMGAFCNQFDKICAATGAAAIYSHHHSKGVQGQKRAMDRASGSGVFARDPDALLDIIRLELSEDIRNNVRDGDATAWRMEATLREFAPFAPVNFWYKYPIHVVDQKNLRELPAEGTLEAGWVKNPKKVTLSERQNSVINAFDNCSFSTNGQVKVTDMAAYLNISERCMRNRLKEMSDSFIYDNGYVFRKGNADASEDDEDEM